MEFSRLLASLAERDGTFSVDVPEDWQQGRSVFGGLQGALALRAMRSLVPPSLPLRVLQVTFVAPVATPVRIAARPLRTGKNVTHSEARLLDGDGQTAAVVVGIFGSARPSRVRVVPEQPPVIPQESIQVPFIPGLSPNFTQHFRMRWLRGFPPFSGSTSKDNVIQVGMAEAGTASEEHLVAIADCVPPVALSLLDAPAAGSSLTWTVEILADGVDGLPLEGYRLDADLVAGHDGYTSQSVMVWGPNGEPVAISRQCMVVFG